MGATAQALAPVVSAVIPAAVVISAPVITEADPFGDFLNVIFLQADDLATQRIGLMAMRVRLLKSLGEACNDHDQNQTSSEGAFKTLLTRMGLTKSTVGQSHRLATWSVGLAKRIEGVEGDLTSVGKILAVLRTDNCYQGICIRLGWVAKATRGKGGRSSADPLTSALAQIEKIYDAIKSVEGVDAAKLGQMAALRSKCVDLELLLNQHLKPVTVR